MWNKVEPQVIAGYFVRASWIKSTLLKVNLRNLNQSGFVDLCAVLWYSITQVQLNMHDEETIMAERNMVNLTITMTW